MEKKNSENLTKKDTEFISDQIFEEKLYKIKIQGGIIKGNSNDLGKNTVDLRLCLDISSQIIINNIARILQSDVDVIKILTVYDDYYSSLQYLLLARFKNNFLKNKNLEEEIRKRINDLEDNKYLISKIDKEKQQIIFEEISLESVKEMFLTLRKRKIEIFKFLLKDFREHKEKYLDFLNKKAKSIE